MATGVASPTHAPPPQLKGVFHELKAAMQRSHTALERSIFEILLAYDGDELIGREEARRQGRAILDMEDGGERHPTTGRAPSKGAFPHHLSTSAFTPSVAKAWSKLTSTGTTTNTRGGVLSAQSSGGRSPSSSPRSNEDENPGTEAQRPSGATSSATSSPCKGGAPPSAVMNLQSTSLRTASSGGDNFLEFADRHGSANTSGQGLNPLNFTSMRPGSKDGRQSPGRRSPGNSASMSISQLMQQVKKSMAFDRAGTQPWINENVRGVSRPRRSSVLGDIAPQMPEVKSASNGWDAMCLVIIIADAVTCGLEVEHTSEGGWEYYRHTSVAFTLWYLFELMLRVRMQGIHNFLTGKGLGWNLLDAFVTVTAIAEMIIEWISSDSGAAIVLRLLRLVRLLRFLRCVSEMRKLILSLVSSLMTLLWSLVLMVLLNFFFAIFFTHSTSSYLKSGTLENNDSELDLLDRDFGSIGRSMLSLFLAITNGRAWGEYIRELHETHPLSSATFVLYVCLSVMGIMNVVTAVFVESAMRASKNYKELMLHEKLLRDKTNVKHMKIIFHSIDKDGDGVITLEELIAFIEDQDLGLTSYFQALDLSARDTQTLFHLLDTAGSGMVDIEEFCDGCMRLGGPATSFDLNTLMYEQRRTNKQVLSFLRLLSSQLQGNFSKPLSSSRGDGSLPSGRLPQVESTVRRSDNLRDHLPPPPTSPAMPTGMPAAAAAQRLSRADAGASSTLREVESQDASLEVCLQLRPPTVVEEPSRCHRTTRTL
mmetsp:Transcript_20770/g.37824  ORF Transcript_20770/g.37824 Transcript_20770/m.37824 type:complete len:764 (-) Transcript_20770:15-2306(-)